MGKPFLSGLSDGGRDGTNIYIYTECLKKRALKWFPRVEAGNNTFTVISASHKRRRKGNRISLR
jgi:hypothetical protein